MDHSGSLELLLTDTRFAGARTFIVSLMTQARMALDGATEEDVLRAWLQLYCAQEKTRIWSYMCRAAMDGEAESLVKLRRHMGLPPFRMYLTTDQVDCNERRGQ